MKPRRSLPLLALAALVLACDEDPADPVDPVGEPASFSVTVDGTEGSPLAAVLLSFDAPVERVRVSQGSGLLRPDGEGTLVAVVMTTASSRIGFTVTGPVSPPVVRVLQAADGNDALYLEPGAFTVAVRELEAQP